MNSIVDLHMHSTASDGSDSPEEIVDKILEAGIQIFSLTDHDMIAGIQRVENELFRRGAYGKVQFISGVELSCIFRDLKCHILGYNFNPTAVPIRSVIESGQQMRRVKLDMRLNQLEKDHGIVLTEEERQYLYSKPNAGRPHIAGILIEHGLATDISDAISRYMKGGAIDGFRQDAAYCISAIRASGGVPVWAHPLGGENEKRISREVFEEKLVAMIGAGIQGLECYYSRYSTEDETYLVSLAQKYGLWISGGSDYHGKNKTIPIGTLNAEGEGIRPEQLTILPNLLSQSFVSMLLAGGSPGSF